MKIEKVKNGFIVEVEQNESFDKGNHNCKDLITLLNLVNAYYAEEVGYQVVETE